MDQQNNLAVMELLRNGTPENLIQRKTSCSSRLL